MCGIQTTQSERDDGIIVSEISYCEAADKLDHMADTRILLMDEKALCRALARHLRQLEAEEKRKQ